jgi:hypothetical protein
VRKPKAVGKKRGATNAAGAGTSKERKMGCHC